MISQQVIIYGAGGHGRVVLDILRENGDTQVIGFLDSNPALVKTIVDGISVLGTLEEVRPILTAHPKVRMVVAIGDNKAREQISEALAAMGVLFTNAIHPRAFVSRSAVIGHNVVVGPGAIICAHARIGNNVIINTGAIVEHEDLIEDNVHIAPGAKLAGRVRVRKNSFVGIGATIIQNVEVGEGSTIGAGAVVLTNVPPGTTFVGVPARDISRYRGLEEPQVQ